MNLRKLHIRYLFRNFFLVVLPVLLGYMLYSTYGEVKRKTIDEFNTLQMVFARQASNAIEDHFGHFFRDLNALEDIDSVAFFNDRGRALMKSYYLGQKDRIKAVTRVDATGRITHTEPYDEKSIGSDISYQEHFRQVAQTQQPVVSEVFPAVQGYKAVACHVPIMRKGQFLGSIAVLVLFDDLVKQYLENIRIAESGYAWVISKTGMEIFCPIPGHIGRTIHETSEAFPSVIAMAEEMMKGKSGVATYSYDMVRGEKTDVITKHAAYFPIRLKNTFWSIVVATPEKEVMATMTGFQQRFFLIGALLILVGLLYSFYFIRTRAVLGEARKRVNAETALRDSEVRLRQVIDLVPHYIYAKDDAGRFILANKSVADLHGTSVSDIIGKTSADFMPYKKEVLPLLAQDQQVLQTEQALFFPENRFTDVRGNVHITEIIKIPFNPSFLESKAVLCVMTDITDRKMVEEALVRSEKQYRDVVENANSIILRWDTNGDILFLNPYGLSFFGYDENEIIGKNVAGTLVPDVESTTQRDLVAMIQNINKDPDSFKYNENENIRRNGERAWVLWANRAIKDDSGNISEILSIGNDITEKKDLEAKLRQSQRMEAIGTLAGGIAHDFNNILMGIQGRTSLMMMDTGRTDSRYEHMEGVEELVKSAANLTRQLLGFARGGKYEVKPTRLNDLVRRVTQMFGRTKKEIIIHPKYRDDLWTVEVDRGQIEQVWMNLLVNAWQAMPDGGDMFIETENEIFDDTVSKSRDVAPGKYIKLSLTDTGTGMEKEIQERIFDPFFTTKEKGRGTGMGLASAYGIIKNHNGIINVSSEKGKGSTFAIYLPASEKDVPTENKKNSDLQKGKETVLIVDDEAVVLDVSEKSLKVLGYDVLTAGSGHGALEVFNNNVEKISLVILDMVMPDMDGGEVFDRIREMKPEIKVLLSSGYSINGKAAEIMNRGCDGFIQKPFDILRLSKKLRDILDA
jgi:two-component system, cell cycle sensor histidine kinase and response regulator CckA